MIRILVKNEPGLMLPKVANHGDAGYDLAASSEPKIVGDFIANKETGIKYWYSIDYIEYDTNIAIAPISGFDAQTLRYDSFHTEVFPRSSNRKKNLILANSVGIVDVGFRGKILCCFKYIFQPEDMIVENGRLYGTVNQDKIYKAGEKICQLVIRKTEKGEFEFVDKLPESQRAENGFGSSGA